MAHSWLLPMNQLMVEFVPSLSLGELFPGVFQCSVTNHAIGVILYSAAAKLRSTRRIQQI